MSQRIAMEVDEGTLRETVVQITKLLADEGRVIEAGWVGLCALAMPKHAPERQRREMRKAFFAGAQHVFSSIVTMLDPGRDATDADLRRMTLIQKELERYAEELRRSLN